MKKYRVEFSEISLEHLKKLDKSVQTIILKWIKKILLIVIIPKHMEGH